MKVLEFTYNWNNKLDCAAFITLRPGQYTVGEEYKVILKTGKDLMAKGVAVVKQVKKIQVWQLNDFMAYLDSGYDAKECKGIISKMYHLYIPEKLDSFEINIVLLKYK